MNPTHHTSPQSHHWTTTNIGEAIPGVQTPLSWTVWRPVGAALRDVGWAVGALDRAEHADHDGLMETFYGRAAFRVDPFALLGDRLPGTTGPEVVASLLGRVPEGLEFHPSNRRLPVIAWRLPATFVRTPRVLRARAGKMDGWYARRLAELAGADLRRALAVLLEAQARLTEMVSLQTITGLGVVQPLHDALARVVAHAGTGDVGTLSGGGGAELAGLVGDLWRASRAELPVEDVARRHGFHGPLEGELSSVVWREDPGPLRLLVEEYARRPDRESPSARLRQREQEAAAMTAEVIAAVPAWQRPAVRSLLRLAARNIPLRGVAKRFLLEAFDVARAAARRCGALLVADGALRHPDDVFYLTIAELTEARIPGSATELVDQRRADRAEFLALSIPSQWRGMPEPLVGPEHDGDAAPSTVHGVGVSAGVVEGRARVVLDVDFAEIEPDEILVAPTTDPSWASVMFISAALVVDIGGALSHAAVVARELGIPCVVNTRTGSAQLRTGDLIRVDGSTGRIDVLARARDVGRQANSQYPRSGNARATHH